MRSIALGILMLVMARVGIAAEVWHTSAIRAIYPQDNGDFIVSLHTESSSCSSTAVPKYYRVTVGENAVTEEGSKKMYALVMMAMALGKQITINFSDLTPSCHINRIWFPD